MIIKALLLSLLLIPLPATSLEFNLGLLTISDTLFFDIYDNELDSNGMIGRIELFHSFELTKMMSINVSVAYLKLYHNHDPRYDIAATGLIISFKLPN